MVHMFDFNFGESNVCTGCRIDFYHVWMN